MFKLFRVSSWQIVLLGVALMTAAPALAQPQVSPVGTPGPDGSQQYALALPSIHITGVKDFKNTNGVVSGVMVVKNFEKETFGDMQYQISLLGALPELKPNEIISDNAPEYNTTVFKDNAFAITGGAEKNINFSYTLPAVPAGEYRLRLQLITAKGWRLGWQDENVAIAKGPQTPENYVIISSGLITTTGAKEGSMPDIGMSVAPATSLTLNFGILNSNNDVKLTPKLSVWEFTSNRNLVLTEKKDPIDIKKGSNTSYSVTVTAPNKPESYYAELSLTDDAGRTSSNVLPFRWVVTGPSAEITVSKVERPVYKANETMPIVVEMIGAADQKTVSTVSLEATVSEGNQVVGTHKSNPFQLDNSTKVMRIGVPLTRTISTPIVTLKIVSPDGTVLDENTMTLPTYKEAIAANVPLAPTKPSKLNSYVAGFVIILLALLAIGAWVLRRRNSVRASAVSTMMVVFMVIMFGVGASALAVTRVTTGGPWPPADNGAYEFLEIYCYGAYSAPGACGIIPQFRFFNNSPIQGSSYSVSDPSNSTSNYSVPVSGYVALGACYNSPVEATLSGSTSASITYTNWSTWNGVFPCQYECRLFGGHLGGFAHRNYVGNVTFPRASLAAAWIRTQFDQWAREGANNHRRQIAWLQIGFNLTNNRPQVSLSAATSTLNTPTNVTMRVTDVDGDLAAREQWALKRPSGSRATWAQQNSVVTDSATQTIVVVESPSQTTNILQNSFTPDIPGQYCVKGRVVDRPGWSGMWSSDWTGFPAISYDQTECFNYGGSTPTPAASPSPTATPAVTPTPTPTTTALPTTTPTVSPTPSVQPGNNPPTALISLVQPTPGTPIRVSDEVIVSGAGSYDPDGDALTYQWKLNGVNKGTAQTMTFTPAEANNYQIELTVRDPQNAADTQSIMLGVHQLPFNPGGVVETK